MFMCKGDVHMLNGLRATIDTLVLFYIKLKYTLLYGSYPVGTISTRILKSRDIIAHSKVTGMDKCGSPVPRDNQEILLGNQSRNLGCPVGNCIFSELNME